jgi:hypothetical protein
MEILSHNIKKLSPKNRTYILISFLLFAHKKCRVKLITQHSLYLKRYYFDVEEFAIEFIAIIC